MARKDSEHQKKSMSMLFRGKAIFKPLNTGRIDEHVSCVREWIANIFFLAVQSLEKLETNLRARRQPIRIITGHTGWTDDLDFAFRHRTEICKPFTKKYTDPSAPYDGYIEDDDTENGARNTLLGKVAVR